MYTEEITPKFVFHHVYLRLYTKVLNRSSNELLETIVGEARIKLDLDNLGSVQDDRILVNERWKILTQIVEGRQGLYEKYVYFY